ncbi:MAG: NAD(P)H-hydrate dehydratase [Elusimicrobiota bacterium]
MEKYLTKSADVKKLFSPRPADSHKYDYGHVLIVAGSLGMTGAAVLTAQAALRSGAGLVTVAVPKSLLPIVAAQSREVMTLPLPETKETTLSLAAAEIIIQFIQKRKVSVLAIGPGLSTHPKTSKLVKKILNTISLPCVLDADGLGAFTASRADLKKVKARLILTPHAGELARLLGVATDKIRQEREKFALNFAKEYQLICLLKGHQSLITDGTKIYLNPTGNPGLATAGSGDVLTGIIAAFLGQGMDLFPATYAAAYLHGLAGDLSRDEKTELGIIAGDIIDNIPKALKKVL